MRQIICIFIALTFLSYTLQAQSWQTSGGNLFFNGTGNVGIGNSAPAIKLDVTGDARAARFISPSLTLLTSDVFSYNSQSMFNYGISWVQDSWATGAATNWLSGWGGIKLFTKATPRLAINYAGNVGIGTTNPNNKLQIADGADDATGYGTVQITRALNPTDNKFHVSFIREGQMYSGIGYVNGTNTLGIWGGGNTSTLPTISFLQNLSVGIGTNNPGPYKLAVEGSLGARKLVVTQSNPWADYVFDSAYNLRSLSEVEQFVKDNKHLPEVPTTADVQKDGIDIGNTQALLLKKIEELTLYVIEQNKKTQQQSHVISEQKEQIEQLKTAVQMIQKKVK